VELEPNPCYPRTPELDRICFEVFPPEGDGVPTALEAALRDGSVDLAFGLGKARAEGLSGFVRQCTPGLSIALLFFNTARPPFDQQRLRLAVAKVLDRSQLARQLYERPFAFVATSLLPPELGRYWDKLSYDPGEARALATDCVLPGRPLELLVVKDPRPYLPHPERAARWIIEQLAALGLPAVIKDSVTSAEFKSRAASGEYDLALAGWALESLDSHHYLESILSSQRVPTQSATDGNRFNVGRLESAEMDAALERYRAEGHDQALADVLCLGATLMPVLPLLYGANIVVHSERLQGVSMGPRGVPALSQVRFAPPASLPLPGHHAAG
ncbi:MAG: ABC transporter substrate-binding protein, partial [Acidobacteriota bacterium]